MASEELDKYEVIQEIGKGSFGSVFKIKKKANGQILCWKELDYGRMQEREKQQLVSEVNALNKLQHPNIVQYYDKIIHKEKKKLFIIMEYCENGDMAQLIKKCRAEKDFVAEDVIWKIFMQVLLALNECHCKRDDKQHVILHRDLKPGNVFFDQSNNVKLGDFGLCRILSAESQYAHTNVGTPYYMSPEQIKEANYDAKTDIWSLGCVLYEMVALRPPFQATNHLALAKKIIQGTIDRIPQRYSEDLQNVINWMLHKEPERRPNVEELMGIPKIQLRMKERKMREDYANLKQRETEVHERYETLKIKEKALLAREAALNKREEMARSRKLQITEKAMMHNENAALIWQSLVNPVEYSRFEDRHKLQQQSNVFQSNFNEDDYDNIRDSRNFFDEQINGSILQIGSVRRSSDRFNLDHTSQDDVMRSRELRSVQQAVSPPGGIPQTLGQKRLLEKQLNEKPVSKIARLSTNNSAKQIKPEDHPMDSQPQLTEDLQRPRLIAKTEDEFKTLKSARQDTKNIDSNSDYYRKEQAELEGTFSNYYNRQVNKLSQQKTDSMQASTLSVTQKKGAKTVIASDSKQELSLQQQLSSQSNSSRHGQSQSSLQQSTRSAHKPQLSKPNDDSGSSKREKRISQQLPAQIQGNHYGGQGSHIQHTQSQTKIHQMLQKVRTQSDASTSLTKLPKSVSKAKISRAEDPEESMVTKFQNTTNFKETDGKMTQPLNLQQILTRDQASKLNATLSTASVKKVQKFQLQQTPQSLSRKDNN